MEVVPTLQVCN